VQALARTRIYGQLAEALGPRPPLPPRAEGADAAGIAHRLEAPRCAGAMRPLSSKSVDQGEQIPSTPPGAAREIAERGDPSHAAIATSAPAAERYGLHDSRGSRVPGHPRTITPVLLAVSLPRASVAAHTRDSGATSVEEDDPQHIAARNP